MERLLTLHFHLTIHQNDISDTQHAYRKGRSLERTLHEITMIAERALSNKKYALIAFLYIEGSFKIWLRAYPPKAEIVSFTRKYKIPNLKLLKLLGETVTLNGDAK